MNMNAAKQNAAPLLEIAHSRLNSVFAVRFHVAQKPSALRKHANRYTQSTFRVVLGKYLNTPEFKFNYYDSP
ncbi:MAG: hypothetical protein KAT65_02420 [Methanophagales archaeon]|nr:hypothetical protein [Methanophagales archaeon]